MKRTPADAGVPDPKKTASPATVGHQHDGGDRFTARKTLVTALALAS
jgi:hypothetical protein